MKRLVLACALLAGAAIAPKALANGPTPYDACFKQAGDYYRINPLLLKAIARQESSMNPRAIGQNTNGTQDLGLMQINTTWLRKLARAGVGREQLMNPCINIMVGAWVLADAVNRFGMSWKAVGVYHSPTDWRQRAYAAKVQKHLMREIQAAQQVAAAQAAQVRAIAEQQARMQAAQAVRAAEAVAASGITAGGAAGSAAEGAP